MNRLKRVLLVDDNPGDNFLTQMVFDKLDCAEHIEIALNGALALEYINTPIEGVFPKPDVICLDINMPIMNGWEFLDEYAKLPAPRRNGVILMMLTTSINPEHRTKASGYPGLMDFTSKPLTREHLTASLEVNFPGRFSFS